MINKNSMRKLEIQYPFGDPKWDKWIQECNEATRELIQTYDETGEIQKFHSLYKKQKKFYTNINGQFSGKCVFCENKVQLSHPPDLDHFRPKGAITDKTNKKIIISTKDGEKDHPGYYWLAYDHTNLLPTCIDCNRPRKHRDDKLIGKWRKFPVEDFRALKPGEETSEIPLLINPVKEDPALHLKVDKTGVFFAIDESPRGYTCIEIFGLNDREGLVDARQEAYEEGTDMVIKLLQAKRDDDKIKKLKWEKRIKSVVDCKESYSASKLLGILDMDSMFPIITKINIGNI